MNSKFLIIFGKSGLFTVLLFICFISNSQTGDYSLAPNSYIFNPFQQNHDGFYIPVKKAYAMWNGDIHIGGSPIPLGIESAEVYWEDVHGLISSDSDYRLTLIGTGEDAKIKIAINKTKEGNAVIVYKVNNVIYWSWHVWITDDPTNGSAYRSYDDDAILRRLNDNSLDTIGLNELKWMDRNLGALSSKLTSEKWNNNGGLMYQWGRKDPIPPLALKGDDFYEVTGSVGRVRHRHARNFSNGAVNIDFLKLNIPVASANVTDNIRASVQNPLSLIYIVNNTNNNQAFYNNNINLPYNWFGTSSTLPANRLSELNLWSDNAKGIISPTNYNSQRKPYNTKSSYDPCPNGWRIPSMFVANLGNYSYIDDVRMDYSPFGLNQNISNNALDYNVYPEDSGTPFYKKGIKVLPQVGFDMSNVNNQNLGRFPGTGVIYRSASLHDSQYTDGHESHIWTATMVRWFDATPSLSARSLRLIPDASQWINNYRPDPTNFPNVYGLYKYYPLGSGETSNAAACRCITDPLNVKNGYDFPTEYFSNTQPTYVEGLNNPNSYLVKQVAVDQIIEIPISKAFSVQSQLLENTNILNAGNFDNLKVNVLWTSNKNLLSHLSLNSQPMTLVEIVNSKILVTIAGNQSGNAVITLHNDSTNNPILWSWHVWVTESKVNSIIYKNDIPISNATNYLNYIKEGEVLLTEFMDRNLGAVQNFPTVANPASISTDEMNKIKQSGGLQYEWGRKDPIPSFTNPDGSTYEIYLGQVQFDGSISYTTLFASSYNNLSGSYIVPFNTYSAIAGVSSNDKINEKVAKVISYSVENPLVYMVPSTFSPSNSANRNLTNGTDWVSSHTEPNLAADRWGRADKKSPFDPCPEGWRIPDVVSVSTSNQYSTFPWSKKNINQTVYQNIMNIYNGVKVNNYGYTFDSTGYKIGNLPFIGIRGVRNVAYGTAPNFLPSNELSGLWTASLMCNYLGRANVLMFNRSTNDMVIHETNVEPSFAMNCRCAKIRLDGDGEETSPILEKPLDQYSLNTEDPDSTIQTNTLDEINQNEIVIYPNPVIDFLKISPSLDGPYFYDLYNLNGSVAKSGYFIDNSADFSDLRSGMYILKINQSKSIYRIIKQ